MKAASAGSSSSHKQEVISWLFLLLLVFSSNVVGRGDEDVMDAAEECHAGWTLTNGDCIKEVAKKPLNPCPHKASLEVGINII